MECFQRGLRRFSSGDITIQGDVQCCCFTCPRDFGTKECLRRVTRRQLRRLRFWLLDVEMGFVWGVACISMIAFVLATIWYIDPALLTLILRFRGATCTTRKAEFLIGISNCAWTSCKVGCTRDFYQCWQILVDFEFDRTSGTYIPPWSTLSNILYDKDGGLKPGNWTKLYPNVRGCGYPPELNCDNFFSKYGEKSQPFRCWVSTIDNSIAMTEFDLERLKDEVFLSLVPLFIFIFFVIYAFCRLGLFSCCNSIKSCVKVEDLPETRKIRTRIAGSSAKTSTAQITRENDGSVTMQVVEGAEAIQRKEEDAGITVT